MIALFLSGCLAAAKESQFFEHKTLFKNWEHFKFSNWGYKNPSKETYQKTLEQNWWGKPILYIGGE